MADESHENGSLQHLLLEDAYWGRRAIGVGVAGTFFIHVFVVSFLWVNRPTFEPVSAYSPYNSYEIELVSEPIIEEEELQSVTTNKNVAESLPEGTFNRSARNQQAAQEEIPDEIDPFNRPTSEGRLNRESHESLPGTSAADDPFGRVSRLFVPQSEKSAAPSSERRTTELSTPEEEKASASPVVEAIETVETEGIAGSLNEGELEEGALIEEVTPQEVVPELPDDPLPLEPEPEEVIPSLEEEIAAEAIPLDPILNPRPRPRIYRITDTAILTNLTGVTRRGRAAIDARKEIGGEYNERFKEEVDVLWNRLADGKDSHEVDSMAKIRFALTKRGYIRDIEVLESTMSAVGESLCRRALEGGQPYEDWSEDMIHVFGDEREITFTFFYDLEN